MQTLTLEQKAAVRNHKHFTINDYPENWQELAEYQDFRNSEHSLCCFCEVDNGHWKYLTTSVY